jgi:uncharacterized protein YfdQ (DUF2303 family)
MLDKSALQHLQQEQSIKATNEAIIDALDFADCQSVVAVHKDFSIENLEKYQASRFRFRGAFCTKSIDGFSDYAQARNSKMASCFIDADAMRANMIFNIGDENQPGHCDSTASLALEMTAPYSALLSIINKPKSQKDIAEFIEDWRQLLTASGEEDADGNKEKISIIKAIHAIRKITIEAKAVSDTETRNFGASSSTMESIDVKSAEMPPAYLHFSCEPYLGLPSRTFDIRLSVLTGERTPSLVLRIVQHETAQEEMAEEFEAIINSKIGNLENKTNIFIGKFSA